MIDKIGLRRRRITSPNNWYQNWEVIGEDIDSPKKDEEEETDGSDGGIAEFIIQLSSNDDGDATTDKIATLGCKWQQQREECCMQRQNIGSERMSAAKPSWELSVIGNAPLMNVLHAKAIISKVKNVH